MASKNKGGLGRGLNALWGDSLHEAASAPKVEAPVKPAAKESAVVETPDVTDRIIHEDREQLVAEDNVTIKSVASRAARPAKPGTSAKPADKSALETVIPREIAEEQETEPVSSTPGDYEVDIDRVSPNPNQPRTFFKKEDLEELASSIEKDGLLQPILVRTMPDGNYQIIAGERRWQACRSIGLKTVPVRIREADEDEALELALIENIQRADLNPIEEAYSYKRIMEKQKISQAELAQMISKGRSTITNTLRLLDLPEDAQQLLFEEKITAGHARAILSITTPEGRQQLTEKLLSEKLSVREAENIARLIQNRPNGSTQAAKPETPKSYKMVARSLNKQLETKVRVKTSQGKNRIEIDFKDEEDLERIFRMISGETEQ